MMVFTQPEILIFKILRTSSLLEYGDQPIMTLFQQIVLIHNFNVKFIASLLAGNFKCIPFRADKNVRCVHCAFSHVYTKKTR